MSLAERRQRLLQAGVEVVASKGLQAATTRAIVASAGMPLASFHYAFESHEKLLMQVMIEMMDKDGEIHQGLNLRGDSQPVVVADALHQHLDDVIARINEYQALRELILHALRNGQAEIARRWQTGRVKRLQDKLVDHGAAHGVNWTIKPSSLAPAVVMAADGVAYAYIVSRDAGAARAGIEHLIQCGAVPGRV